MAEEKDSEHIDTPDDGSVNLAAQPTVTEQEVEEDRQVIVARLDTAYRNLTEAMQPYQEKWDNSWQTAMGEAVIDGVKAGVSDWGDDFADFFKKETWVDIGGKIETAAGTAYDTANQYAGELYKKIVANVNAAANDAGRLTDHPDDTLKNWAWHVYEDDIAKPLESYRQEVISTLHSLGEAAEKSKKIYTHKDAILNLPNLIAAGDRKSVQNFVDTVLMDIDPEYAKAIKEDPNFYVVLEIIDDHESALAYLTYTGLAIEAIPPNFYTYLAAKGSAYLMIEVILLIVTAILSAGTAAAARISMITARIAMSSAKVAKVVKKVEHFKKAVQAFIDMLEDFQRAADDLQLLGRKLNIARSRGFKLKGSTKTTIKAKREAIKRDKKCAICGSTKHTTPHGRLGTVKYE